ncbi:hypothetical protein [Sinorhizobium meliloti]|uniref:hypothetical protein n=1 Tax=Rhizobium meliloti TaxID=382 RepID=UPI000425215E|nr:hypothetical protein [Sinorhizobium meliloti]UFX08698.1 hypothetical protein SmelRRI128_01900 [Sinorhizobium meliloti]
MATKYDAKIRKLQEQAMGALEKVMACPFAHELKGVPAYPCDRKDCACGAAAVAHEVATKGRGRFILVDGSL